MSNLVPDAKPNEKGRVPRSRSKGNAPVRRDNLCDRPDLE